MPAGDKQVATLRTLLTGEFDRHKEMVRDLVTDDEKRGYLDLVAAAVVEITEAMFGTGDDATASVVEWVGKIRSQSDFSAGAFDPVISEEVILCALGKTEAEELSARQLRDGQLLLLPALVDDRGLDEAGIDELLATALGLLNEDQG